MFHIYNGILQPYVPVLGMSCKYMCTCLIWNVILNTYPRKPQATINTEYPSEEILKMARLTLLLLYLALLAPGTLVPVHGRRVIRAAPGSATTGCFVVKLKDSATHEQFESAVNNVIPFATENKVYTRVEGEVSKMFTMKMSHEAAEAVRLRRLYYAPQ